MEEPSGGSQFRGFAVLRGVSDVFGDVVDGLAIDLHRAGTIELSKNTKKMKFPSSEVARPPSNRGEASHRQAVNDLIIRPRRHVNFNKNQESECVWHVDYAQRERNFSKIARKAFQDRQRYKN